jgi:transcriptional regulator with XRE-family HTH domain
MPHKPASEPYNLVLGARAKALRHARGLRLEAVAAALDKSHLTVRSLEAGKGGRSDMLPRLAAVLGVSLDYLFGLTEDPTPADTAAPAAAEEGAPADVVVRRTRRRVWPTAAAH